jgi:Zn-dependent peptidase ImmA (M78 family)
MPADLRVPFLEPERIRNAARSFLEEHHSERVLPVPIEDIVDLKLRLHIVPNRGMRSRLLLDGCTSRDFQKIYVDADLYNEPRLETRYRFTPAHEVGHLTLHREILEEVSWSSPDEYKVFEDRMAESERSKFEWQAYEFAGLLLVPPDRLTSCAQDQLPLILSTVNEAKDHNLPRDVYLGAAVDLWCTKIAPHFHVSVRVLEKRLKADCLLDLIP